MSERVLHEWSFAGYVCRIVETEPGIVNFEQAQGPPIGREQIGPLAFNRTEKPLGCANEIIHLSQALAEANVINRDLSKAIQGWQEDRNRRERGETTAWLIEMKDYVHPVPAWWGGSRYGWRHDANEAVRFCRQADAERVIESMSWKHNAIATQHSWIPPMPEMFHCPDCGPNVAADEDGCCANCGADCTIEPTEEALRAELAALDKEASHE